MSSKLLPLDMWALTMYFERTVLAKANTFQQLSLLKLRASKCPFYFLWSSPMLNDHFPLQLPSTPFLCEQTDILDCLCLAKQVSALSNVAAVRLLK